MKLSITIVLLSIASFVFGQNSSRSNKIDENERKRLENQYNALNNFYINDDGLVVYKTQADSTSQDRRASSIDTTSHKSAASTNSPVKKNNSEHLINEDSDGLKSTPTEKPLSTRVVSSSSTSTSSPVPTTIIKKEALKPTEATSHNVDSGDNSHKETATATKTVKNSPISSDDHQDNTPPKVNASVTSTNTGKKNQSTPSTTSKSSIFNKNRQSSQYKTMEEAALAVEALLDDLRKEQAQTTGAGSMSSRLSGGAGRATLRKKPVTNATYLDNSSDNATTANRPSQAIIEDDTSAFGTEPTYYINGKEVDKIEVNKLRKKEIISKEVRTRNTVSGNPNGEVWYEVKYEN